MESKARVYQDFEPSMEWVPEDDSDTLLLYLPGFAKEQLRVQLRSRNLIVSGERKLQQNTWSRFRVEFPVSANCDLNKISAKFEESILFVRQPKLIITVAAKPAGEESLPAGAETPQKPVDEPNVGEKTFDSNPNPAENKDMGKDQDVPPEEKSEKIIEKDGESKTKKGVVENGWEKKPQNLDNRNKKAAYGELDNTAKTALDDFKEAVSGFADKLKTSRNAIVVLLIGVVLGVYVAGWFNQIVDEKSLMNTHN